MLAAADLPEVAFQTELRPRHFVYPEAGATAAAREPVELGRSLWHGTRTFLLGSAAVFAAILALDYAAAKYQQTQVWERSARQAALAEMALGSLQSEIQSVSDLGDGRYELAVDLRNVGDDRPIYVMSPDMHAYVQVGKAWQEVPLRPTDDKFDGVLKIDGKHTYRYVFDARVRGFTQLLPNYMHVRFSDTMLVSPSSMPQDDVFERRDNYYVYLKPYDVADDVVLKRTRFAGRPPVWIPMPPH